MNSFACMCDYPKTPKEVEKLKKNADFVIVGTFIKNLNYIDSTPWPSSNEGYDILFLVKSTLKGKLKSDTLAIRQDSGNCNKLFEKGKEYLIMGSEIKEINSKVEEYYSAFDQDEMPPPPPSGTIKKNIYLSYYDDNKEISFWENVILSYNLILTSSCSVFDSKSEVSNILQKKSN